MPSGVGRSQKSVSVVIRGRDEASHLPRLLSAIQRQSCLPDEVVVVDSGSRDATARIAEEFGAMVVHIAPELFSFGRSLNLGCASAHGEILVFASAHVYPVDDKWIESLISPLLSDEAVALSYGRQTGDERTHHSEFEIMRRWFPLDSDGDQQYPFCNNANCAVRRTVWERLQYDESLSGLEDIDWACRASRGRAQTFLRRRGSSCPRPPGIILDDN